MLSQVRVSDDNEVKGVDENVDPNTSIVDLGCTEQFQPPVIATETCGFDIQEVYIIMKENECTYLNQTEGEMYKTYRRYVVDWACEVGESLLYDKQSIHSACKAIDRVLQLEEIMPTKDHLKRVSLCCLRLCAKYEDCEKLLPPLRDHLRVYEGHDPDRHISASEFARNEVNIMQRLNWSLSMITPLHILNLFLKQDVLFDSDIVNGQEIDNIDCVQFYVSYCNFFADLCLQEHAFQKFKPSMVASSILALARKALNIQPYWREELTDLTHYTFEDIERFYREVWCHFVENFPQHQQAEPSPTSVSAFPGHFPLAA